MEGLDWVPGRSSGLTESVFADYSNSDIEYCVPKPNILASLKWQAAALTAKTCEHTQLDRDQKDEEVAYSHTTPPARPDSTPPTRIMSYAGRSNVSDDLVWEIARTLLP